MAVFTFEAYTGENPAGTESGWQTFPLAGGAGGETDTLNNFASTTLHCLAQRPRSALIGYWRDIAGKLITEEP